MKPATVFLGEMTDPEVEAFLERSRTVIVPVGSTEQHGPHAPLATFSAPGSVHRATRSGTWGDARQATPAFGERYLQVVVESTVRFLDDIDRTEAAMPPRPGKPGAWGPVAGEGER